MLIRERFVLVFSPPGSIVRLAVENDTNLLEAEALSQSSEYGRDFDFKFLGAPAIIMPVHMTGISDIDSHFTHTQDLAFWEEGGYFQHGATGGGLKEARFPEVLWVTKDGTFFATHAKNNLGQVDGLDGFFPDLWAEHHKFHSLLVIESVVAALFLVIVVGTIGSWQTSIRMNDR
jgi:hypothetical protein